MSYGINLCPEQDSNLHASRHAHLKRARLPFRHLGIGFGSAKVESFFDMTKFLWVFLFCDGSFYALESFGQSSRVSILGRKCSLIPALFVFLWLEVTKIVYFIGNEHMLIAHDSNRLRFS